jgi:asparagine synthase (glutamine-hydrolysing)
MPGIVGIISRRLPEASERLVRSMTATMRHEPFYKMGTCSMPELGVCVGWISPEVGFAADQAFTNEQKNISLVFAGECFIDPETKSRLKQNGHVFSEKGGDFLVHLYEDEGEKFFVKLNGLFSGLLIDQRQGKILLFNDRYGVERIYWHETVDAFYFASEAKALLRVLPALREFDPEGVAHFLAFNGTLAERTLFRGISLMPGGSLWEFSGGKCIRGKYFSPETWEKQPVLKVEEFEAKFSDTFRKILPRYFDSDSKIGISLTAGLDTRIMMACMPAAKQKPVCYTFDGEKTTTFDSRLAGRVAGQCGLEHQVLRIGDEFFSKFASLADRTVYISDGYFGVTGTHEIYLNRIARALTPVRLGGAFGGEILREVSTFRPRRLSPEFVNPKFKQISDDFAGSISDRAKHPVTFAAFQEIPWNIFGSPAICRSQLNFRTPYLDNEIVSVAYQMPDTLRRSPQLALRLVQENNPSLGRIPTDMGLAGESSRWAAASKRLFCKATFKLDYLLVEGMPGLISPLDPVFKWSASALGIQGLHKYLHYRGWFRHELAAYVKDAIAQCQQQESPFWNPDFLPRMAREHARGRGNYVQEINLALTLNAVQRLLFRDLPR